ncbi:MAG TPA: GNAT family protein, partial [Verrucomicrobiae bacterium]|nr:GNAT family protein [Verrucomicrobiae bacterium]
IPSDDSFFDFKCPYCGAVNSFPTTSANTLQECASCMASVVVPSAGVEIGGKLPLPMSTPRLLLRRFRPDDSVKLVEMVAQDETSTLAVNETDVDQWIEQQRAARFTQSDAGIYLAIELVDGGELAGYVSLYYSDVSRTTAGFSLTITPARRRQGLGLEATGAVMDFAFDGLCARRLAVSSATTNTAASGMLAKAGLRKEGEFVKSWFDGKDWVNVSWYALLKEERAARA